MPVAAAAYRSNPGGIRKEKRMIKSILIPIDGSAASLSALENGADLARIAGAVVRGLFVEDESRFTPPAWAASVPEPLLPDSSLAATLPIDYYDLQKEWRQTELVIQRAFDEQCQSRCVRGTFSIIRGMAAIVMIEQAKTSDLVVIGRRGKGAAPEGKAPGSHTEALLMKTTRPVMVVPAGAERTARILIAYDGSESAQRAIDYGAIFTNLQPSKVDVLTVGENAEETQAPQDEARKFLAPYNVEVSFVVRGGNPAAAIAKHAEEIGAGLIVMGAYGHSRLRELLFGSTTRDVLEAAKCPVLLAG
jgi:nucleotide-binding universal stress UspA family protein